MSQHDITVTVDGVPRTASVESRRLLVHQLRDEWRVTSPHIGCDTTQCGACTVHLDGRAVKSCTVLAVQADGARVDTVDGLSASPDSSGLHPLQQAFTCRHALQCGYCTPGMVMSTLELLRRNPDPTEDEVRAWLKGNFCRCTGYQHIVDAVRTAADAGRAAAEATEVAR